MTNAITILLETVGLWFMNNKMVISPERADAAYWCFQFSVITFGVNLLSTPYKSIVIARTIINWILIAVQNMLCIFLLSLFPNSNVI